MILAVIVMIAAAIFNWWPLFAVASFFFVMCLVNLYTE